MIRAGYLVLLLGLVVAGGGGALWWGGRPVGVGPAQRVEIPVGMSAGEIAQILKQRGLIRSVVVFSLYSRVLGFHHRLRAGEYEVSPSESVEQILRRMWAGDVVRHRLTLPEGITAQEVARRIERAGLGRAGRFLALVQQPARFWIPQMQGNRAGSLEGYLFPDTYLLPRGLPEEEIVRILVARFEEATRALLSRPLPLGLSPHEVVTVASLVEREARVPRERARIAGVIYNRLRAGMPLQIDASVLYALGIHRPVVRARDLEVDSPYNTYRAKGLPPGPIASPGLAALRAAVEPEQHGYYYYVAQGDGTHLFSRTFEEHLQAIRRTRNGR
ncbi:MAG: endolytic transglycosylase MltG [Armatimonadota bacterium]|nr:endolytic transglycosylase MltG [Armatimonadota bacterium]MDR7439173.1 endolytic transglycosylase MltG [Armatimonadota bacterium]MDR7563808.1 endolytic transglycosylase MltG [Armatimonadota bacterium]MDR7567785.1 endolytic transglycosylase MltG [Armatimonadota bacterium]MDR7600882.1 endolytic transglycosylase MltG [Armatimonadota bacterium]